MLQKEFSIVHPQNAYSVIKCLSGWNPLKDYIAQRAMDIATYIIENNATVRQAAKQFGVSKSTVHVEVTK